jgi:hypothetical protein
MHPAGRDIPNTVIASDAPSPASVSADGEARPQAPRAGQRPAAVDLEHARQLCAQALGRAKLAPNRRQEMIWREIAEEWRGKVAVLEDAARREEPGRRP